MVSLGRNISNKRFYYLKSNTKICPSNLLIAPTINFFNLIDLSFNKNFVLKLSEASTII